MKDFSFQFYPGDVLRQIALFSDAQKASYLTVMTIHIENISFSYDIIMKITKSLSDSERSEFLRIFSQDEQGNYYIDWIRKAIDARSNYLESRSLNKKGKKKSYDFHMENVYINEYKEENKEIIKEKKSEKKLLKSTQEIQQITSYEESLILANSIDEVWSIWLDYKKTEHKFQYKSGKTSETAKIELIDLSVNDLNKAKEIVKKSIQKRWKGLFEHQEIKPSESKNNLMNVAEQAKQYAAKINSHGNH